MVKSTVLMVTGDASLVGAVRRELKDLGGTRIDVATTVEDACEVLGKLRPRLILLDRARRRNGYDAMDRLLWATSKLPHGVPVVVVADQYRVEQALMCYRMGVADYISRSEHYDSLATVLAAYLTSSVSDTPESVDSVSTASPAPSTKKSKPRSSSTPIAVAAPTA